jgi:hypothetical protein
LALVAVVLACVPILLNRASDPSMLRDTDTKVLLHAIRVRQDPLSWFTGDWPLENHFYRPVSTLFFELDNRLYGDNAAGYGLTNALLCVACVLLLFWLVRELTDSPLISGSCAVLFALWHFGGAWFLYQGLWYLTVLALLGGLFRHGFRIQAYAAAPLLLLFLQSEVLGVMPLYERMVAWLPGRTASVMTLFALPCLAAYARYERLGAQRRERPPLTPLDPPATRNTVVAGASRRRNQIGWGLLSVVMLALALGSYEQAVMLPAALLGVALTMRFQRFEVRFGWQAVFWSVLFGYLALRHALVPSAPSGYQLQQFRDGTGVYLSILDYVFPALTGVPGLLASLEAGPLILLTSGPYGHILSFANNVTAFVQARRTFILPLAGWALSSLTYLPMAWLNQFDHYHYLPMALRTILVVGLAGIAGRLLVSAWSPPERQAPPRPSPAPGSLPRP